MKYEIVYSTQTGNTEELAMAVKEAMAAEDCVYLGGPERAGFSEAPIIFAGFWTDKGCCSEDMGQWLEELKGKQVFLFGTAGFGGSEEYFKTILQRVGDKLDSSNAQIGTFMCQGSMPGTVLKRYEVMLEQDPHDEKIMEMIENYHQALAHPDRNDKMMLRECVRESLQSCREINSRMKPAT